MQNRKMVLFQGQIETALRRSRAGLDLRIKKVFTKLRIQSHLTGAGIRKCEGYSPRRFLFVLPNLAFLHLQTVHDLLQKPLAAFGQAHKDTFYRFKKAEWNWRPFYRRFLTYLARGLQWSRTRKDNCLVLDTTVLPRRGKTMENTGPFFALCG